METIQELANYFVHIITQAQVGIEGRVRSAEKALETYLSEGWTLTDLKYELDQFASEHPELTTKVYHLQEIMGKKTAPHNLLDEDTFYYHNELRLVSTPVVIKKDDNGVFQRSEAPFTLQMKKRYTMEDLLAYFYEKNSITSSNHTLRQDEGKFTYLLNQYTIDELLFATDIATHKRKEQGIRSLRNIFDLERYVEDAKDSISKKRNQHRLLNINREVF